MRRGVKLMTQSRQAAWVIALVVLAGARMAGAQDKPKATSGKQQVWQVEFATAQERYTGTMTLTIAKGVVSGKMLLDSPARVEGTVEGKQTGDALSLDYPFTMTDQNCTGRVQAEAKLANRGEEASGPFTATGCSEEPVEGTFTMKKGAPAK